MRSPLGGRSGGNRDGYQRASGNLSAGGDPTNTVGGFPGFRCSVARPAVAYSRKRGENQIVFTAFDPVQGRKAELVKVPVGSRRRQLGLSLRTGSRVVLSVFDYKAGDIQVVPLAGGTPQKLKCNAVDRIGSDRLDGGWQQPVSGELFFARDIGIVRMPLERRIQTAFSNNQAGIFSRLLPSPDGRYLAFGPIVTTSNAWTIASFPRK